MTVKSIVRSLTPPFIWVVARAAKRLLMPSPPGPEMPAVAHAPLTDFPDWDSAMKASGSYVDTELTRFRAERFALYAASGNLPPVENSPLFWLAREIGAPITVADFGGAFGEYGASFLARFPQSKYTVIETAPVVSCAPAGSVSFLTEMPDSFDVFYASGVLQYLPGPYPLLRIGFERATKAVVVARTFFSDEERFRVQGSMLFENGTGEPPPGFENRQITYPIRTLREPVIGGLAKEFGFSLRLRHSEASDIQVMGIDTRLLVYVKSDQPS